MKDQCTGIRIKQKEKEKYYKYIYFSKSNFVGVNRLFLLIYSNSKTTILKDLSFEGIIYQKVLSRISVPSSIEKTSMTELLILI